MAFSDDEIAESFAEATCDSTGGSVVDAIARLEGRWDDAGGSTRKQASGVSVVAHQSSIGSDYRNLTAGQRFAVRQIDEIQRAYPKKEARRILRDYARAELWNQRLSKKVPHKRVWSFVRSRQRTANHFIRLMKLAEYRQRFPQRKRERQRKFSDAQIVDIRHRYAAGGVGYKSLAKAFNTSPAMINMIVHGDVYRSSGGPMKRMLYVFTPDSLDELVQL